LPLPLPLLLQLEMKNLNGQDWTVARKKTENEK
jgi:hypothetical protein